MARPLRIEYPGALYHISVRGNNKDLIFYQDSDRELLLSVLSRVIKKYNWICHAYCLMNNHYHLCIETPKANLSIGMRDLNSIFAQSFNKKYKFIGHVFQGRFNSFLIEKEPYLLNIVGYIVLNPIRANLVFDPKDWSWSNYRATAGLDRPPPWLEVNWTRHLFADNQENAVVKYQEFILSRNHKPSPFKAIHEGKILGSPQFIHKIWEMNQDSDEIIEVPKPQRIIGRPSLEDIFVDIDNKKERDEAVRFACFVCGYSGAEIAKRLKMSSAAISMICKGLR